ncbi:MAG TPA: 7-cyano-7-deazaguanine/7-aminomethyl-7-deazaguanine transporter [Sutterella sp.]|nr:7-cyano-7-deazaguanine/7-aminomethyl-7-deazaguanine transporter [Sutterella sp.]
MVHGFHFPFKKLWLTHIFIIVLSNYVVQLPITIFGVHTTWGTFTYPFIFLTTDLTVRLFGQKDARKVVFYAMIPALILSYLVGTLFEHGHFQGFAYLSASMSLFAMRITLASLTAYVIGQLMDIFVFQKLRRLKAWWPAPAASSILGNLVDTYVFFGVAFYATNDAFMASHWFELATVDYCVKVLANLSIFVPVYGVVLNFLMRKLRENP